MGNAIRRKNETLLENCCSRLGILLEHRYSGLALLEAKRRAEKAAVLANEAMVRAKVADHAKSKFLANMAHELRTPLNAIIGFSEVITLNNSHAKEHYVEYASYVHDAGKILLDIINDILDIARIEAGKVELQERLVSLDDLIQAAVTTIRPASEKKSLDIEYDAWQPALLIYIDRTRFKQIILNLMSNAVKFTEPHGRIRIGSVIDERGDLVISLSDTGIGIAPEQIEKVLEPFEQAQDHLTREHEGSGLGLAIAKGLIELHGGGLLLRSELGVGTTAIVRLPRDRVHRIKSSAA